MRNNVHDGETRLIENAKAKDIDGGSGAVPQGEYDAHELLRTLVSSIESHFKRVRDMLFPVWPAHVPLDFNLLSGALSHCLRLAPLP